MVHFLTSINILHSCTYTNSYTHTHMHIHSHELILFDSFAYVHTFSLLHTNLQFEICCNYFPNVVYGWGRTPLVLKQNPQSRYYIGRDQRGESRERVNSCWNLFNVQSNYMPGMFELEGLSSSLKPIFRSASSSLTR